MRFFYNPKMESWDYLYRAVMSVVFSHFKYRPHEKAEWLGRFRDGGYYLIDATHRPINRYSRAERDRALEATARRKVREIIRLVSPSTPIILIKKNIFQLLNDPLRAVGYNVINHSYLPFPSHGHQRQFAAACRACLRRCKRGR